MMINEALRLIRIYHDLNQTMLAEKVGLPASRISEIENYKRKASLEVIQKYSEAFKIPTSAILFFAESIPDAKRGERVRTHIAGTVINILKFIEDKSCATT